MNFSDLVCKQCGQPIYAGGTSYMNEIIHFDVRVIDSDPNPSTPTQVHTTDAGVFCSKRCLVEYLQKGEVKV